MDNRDGTYDVKFDDGDRDREVPKSSIKKLGGDNVRDAGSEAKLSEGDKVEARCKGSKKHYPGKIFMDNRDGTYDVKFDDGDRDREVPKSSIKKLGGCPAPEERPISGSGASRSGGRTKLIAGTRIEARYRGRERFYKGTILRARVNGKFDLVYDEGMREMSVSPDCIRVAE